jgi:hypothetical protein
MYEPDHRSGFYSALTDGETRDKVHDWHEEKAARTYYNMQCLLCFL